MAVMLQRGATGDDVAALQERLAAAGFPVRVDGVFGPDTAEALTAFQRNAGLRPDAIYGDKTRGALEMPLPRPNPSRAVADVAAALMGGGGQGTSASGPVEMLAEEQPVAVGRIGGGIGSDPSRNMQQSDILGALHEAAKVNEDMRSLRAGQEPFWGTGARLPAPEGINRATANSPFADPGVTAVDPNFRVAPAPVSAQPAPAPPAPPAASFDERWSVRPPQRTAAGDGMFSNQALASEPGLSLEQQRALALARARRRRAIGQQAPEKVTEPYSGSILPFSKDEQGNVRFDPKAGILGALLSGATLPGDVYAGRVDPQSEEGLARTIDLATFASPMNPGVRAGDMAVPGVKSALVRREMEPPTAEALKAASSAGYDAARDMGVHYSSDAVKKLVDEIRFQLGQDGIVEIGAPKTYRILDELGAPPEGSTAPLAGLEAARRAFQKSGGRDFANPTDQEAARRVVGRLDDFMGSPDPASVVAGPAAAAGETVAAARGNYAAAKRSERLQGIEDSADLRAAAADSGLNTENALRQRAVSLLQSPKDIAGYSPAERAAIEAVARGTAAANTLRFVGNLLGGGGGLGAVASGAVGGMAGSAFGGPAGMVMGALSPALGLGAKKVAAALARARLNAADEMVRRRSPLYEEMMRGAPLESDVPAWLKPVIQAIIASQASQAGSR